MLSRAGMNYVCLKLFSLISFQNILGRVTSIQHRTTILTTRNMRSDCASLSSTEDTRDWNQEASKREDRGSMRSSGKVLFRNDSASMPEDALRRELAYQWYTRCGRPSRKNMKERVCKIDGCDITSSDVDLLPWKCKGLMVDHGAMMKMMKEASV